MYKFSEMLKTIYDKTTLLQIQNTDMQNIRDWIIKYPILPTGGVISWQSSSPHHRTHYQYTVIYIWVHWHSVWLYVGRWWLSLNNTTCNPSHLYNPQSPNRIWSRSHTQAPPLPPRTRRQRRRSRRVAGRWGRSRCSSQYRCGRTGRARRSLGQGSTRQCLRGVEGSTRWKRFISGITTASMLSESYSKRI